jgi:hypothetical protein
MDSSSVKTFGFCFAAVAVVVLAWGLDVRATGDDVGYAPEQPIAFSHRLHAGEMKIDCLYCHYGAESSRMAGMPPVGLCMNCHAFVGATRDAVATETRAAKAEGREPTAPVSKELGKQRALAGRRPDGTQEPGATSRPITWNRVYDLPDHVCFDHRRHVARGVECRACHGAVETMERVRQQESLSMGWCVECHRINPAEGAGALPAGLGHPQVENHASIDCSACHF